MAIGEQMTTKADAKSYTFDEFMTFIDLPENRARIFELIDGEMVEKMPESFIPSHIGMTIGFFLNLYLRENPIGWVTGAAGGYRASAKDAFVPDVGYVSKARMPELPERLALLGPDLAVEVKSPTDKIIAMRRKVERYLALGTLLVWLVFPESKTVEVYTADEDADVVTLGVGDVVDGGAVLPGFTLPVSEIFKGLS
jgi:Uma2 family endonuclease